MSPILIIVATRNLGKQREIVELLSGLPIVGRSLRDYPDCPEVAEDGASYLENARKKARAVAAHCGAWALADDSGLEVEALGWRPGILSARYAGELADDARNNRKLLEALSGVPTERRRAMFRCTLVLAHPDGREFVTEGELWGLISPEMHGIEGFGYDPLFLLPDRGRTLAELGAAEKNRISHRRLALEKMKSILSTVLPESASPGR